MLPSTTGPGGVLPSPHCCFYITGSSTAILSAFFLTTPLNGISCPWTLPSTPLFFLRPPMDPLPMHFPFGLKDSASLVISFQRSWVKMPVSSTVLALACHAPHSPTTTTYLASNSFSSYPSSNVTGTYGPLIPPCFDCPSPTSHAHFYTCPSAPSPHSQLSGYSLPPSILPALQIHIAG